MLPIKIQLPEDFLEEEERDGYVVSSEMKKVWAVLLDLLQEFIRVCEKYDIRWYADGGTILGAARHKGMIPWDDDIDVMMLRPEYDRFLRVAKNDFNAPYFLQTEKSDKGSAKGHAQLRNSLTTGLVFSELKLNCKYNRGLFLDIFPIENIEEQNIEFYSNKILYYKERSGYIRNLTLCFSYRMGHLSLFESTKRIVKHFMYEVANLMTKNYGYEDDYEMFEKLLTYCKNDKSEYVAKLVLCPYKERRKWRREWFNDVVYLPFETFFIPVPIGYENLLDVFYGDWHKVRIGEATHGGVIADAETPYWKFKVK